MHLKLNVNINTYYEIIHNYFTVHVFHNAISNISCLILLMAYYMIHKYFCFRLWLQLSLCSGLNNSGSCIFSSLHMCLLWLFLGLLIKILFKMCNCSFNSWIFFPITEGIGQGSATYGTWGCFLWHTGLFS